jgi:hypothetical protein
MPTNISSLNKQLDEIEDILKPVLDKPLLPGARFDVTNGKNVKEHSTIT